MIVRQYAPCSLGRSIICLGKQGEINALRVEFDVSAWMAMYPDATVKLMHFAPDRPQGNPVIPTLGVEGTLRVWIVGEEDTAGAGNGVIELLLIDERTGSTIKSATGYTTVLRSPSAGIEAQEAEAGYVRYDVDQSALLTDEQKAMARKNIGAGTADGTGSGGILKETDPTVPAWAKQPSKPTYTASEVGALPSSYTPPVTSVNGKTGAVALSAQDVGARPDTWTPSASDVGADAAGTASGSVAAHNTSGAAHADLRALIEGLTSRLNALADSDDTTLDQLSEIVAYIKSNKALIDAVTTGKVSVSDIVDNLTTNASGKVLSAAQGVALKAMIDGIVIPTALPNPQPITINGQRYDGSEAVTVTVSSEGGGTPVEIDGTLTQSGKAADAKAVGDQLSALNEANAQQDEVIAGKANDADLATVAKSGSYNDLSNKPTIPTVPSALPNPNKFILSGAVTAEYDGSSEVRVEIPAGGGYTLPIASPTTLGGVKPAAKTDEMTQSVGVDALGGLWTSPGGGTTDYTALENKPSINGVELTGNKSLGDLGIGEPTDEQVSGAVQDWLDAHPEATTTVADGSITPPKLSFYKAKKSVKTLADVLDMTKFEHITSKQAQEIGLWYDGQLSEHVPVNGDINLLKRNRWGVFNTFCDLNIVFYGADGVFVKSLQSSDDGTNYSTLGQYRPEQNEYFALYSITAPEGAATYRWYIKNNATIDDLKNIEFLDFETLIDHKPWKNDNVTDMLEQNGAINGEVFWNYRMDKTNSVKINANVDPTVFDFIPKDFANARLNGYGNPTSGAISSVVLYFQAISLGEKTEIYLALKNASANDAGFRINCTSGLLMYDENFNPLTARSLSYEAQENEYVTVKLLKTYYDGNNTRLYKVTVAPVVKHLFPVLWQDYTIEDRVLIGDVPFEPTLTREETVSFEAPLSVKNYINDMMRPEYYSFKQIGRLVPNGDCNYVAWNHNCLHYDATRNKYVMTMRGSMKHGVGPNQVQFVVIDPVTLESSVSDIVVGGVTADWANGFTLDDSNNYLMVCKLSGVTHYVTSTNGGSTWTDGGAVVIDTRGAVNNIDTSKYDYTSFFDLHRLSTGTLLASYDDTVSPTNKSYPHIARSTDGVNWTLVELPSGQAACEMAFYEHEGTVMMIGRRNSYQYNITNVETGESYNNAVISYSYDDGQTWTAATGSATVRANVQNVSVREHDGVVELMAVNRDFNKYPRGYIYHYTATPEEAISDRFTLREVFQCNAYGASDVTGGALAFDRYGHALFAYSDNHGTNSDYDYLHFLYGARAEAPMVCADGVASEFLPYSGQKVQAMIDALDARIKALEV